MNYLALDYGSKHIGLAKGTSELKIAIPFKILKNSSAVLEDLRKIASEEKIGELVVGYPLTLRGKVGSQADATDKFINKLKRFNLPVRRQDERFSSQSAVAAKSADHASAAALILQSYLDAL